MGAWRSAPRNWKPRLPVGSARPKRRTPKRTSFTAATRPARRCRTGAPARTGGRGVAGRGRRQAAACGEDPAGQGRIGGGGEGSGRSRAQRAGGCRGEAGSRVPAPRRPETRSAFPDAGPKPRRTSPIPRAGSWSKDGFVQAYNAQIAVDAEAQIIVAQDATQSARDCAQLLRRTDAVEATLGRKPEQASADAGYCSEENLAGLEARSIYGYVATGRARDAVAGTAKDEADRAPPSTQPAETPTRVEAMRAKIKAGGYASPYRLRKQLPAPVFGQIQQARGFRQ